MSQLILGMYYIVALLAAYISLKAYRRNTSLGNKIVRVMMATVFIIIFYSFNFWVDNYILMSLGNSLSFVMLDLMILAFLDYVVEFLDYKKRIPKAVWILVITCIVLDCILLMQNVLTENVNSYRVVEFEETEILVLEPKLLFHLHIAFLGILSFLIIWIMLKKLFESPKSYWKKYYCLILGLILAVVVNALHLLGVLGLDADISIAAYGILGILMYFNTFHYTNMVNRQITRSLMLDYMSEPILLFDYEGKLSEAAEAMMEILPLSCLKPGIHISEVLKAANIENVKGISENQTMECTLTLEGKERHYDCHFSCMRDEKKKIVGYMILFHDITTIQEAYYALEQSITHDALTGLYNKHSFDTKVPKWDLDCYWPVSVCVCNINNFKRINKEYSVRYGDYILKQFAKCVTEHVGEQHYVARGDGGDIIAILEKTEEAEAVAVFERIKEALKQVDDIEEITMEYGIMVVDKNNPSTRNAVDDAISSMRHKKMLKNASASSALVDSLKQTLSESDYETEEHVERTQQMAARLGREMNLADTDIAKLELLAVLHDIGKVAIPQHVLLKRGKLTPEERKIIQQHTVKGYRIAKSSPELGEIAECILSHHENWDGTGYPNGIAGEEIPLLARIISAVDSHDVMVHNRPYHTAMPERDAIEELKRCAGTQFDPYVIENFVSLLEREEL